MTETTAFVHATVVTGDKTGTVLPDQTVLVDAEGKIADVSPSGDTPTPVGARVVDASGTFVMPGLLNAHAHLFSDGKPLPSILVSPWAEKLVSTFMHSRPGGRWLHGRAKRAVLTQMNSGVTTIRSLGDPGYEVVQVGREIDRGDYLGPRLLASGPLMAITGGHGAPQTTLTCDTAAQTRTNVRQSLRHGVKAVKIAATGGVTDAKEIGHAGTPEMTEANMRIICEEAHDAGVLVAAHAQSAEGILAALRAGVDTIEHGATMTDEIIELFLDNPRSLRGWSALVPTLMAALPLVRFDTQVTGANEISQANARIVLDEMIAAVQQAVDNDIALGMGTDSALTFVTHYNTWREIDFMIRYGKVSPALALHAATRSNARILGVDDVTGAVEKGKAADLVVTAANPLENIRTLARPLTVVVRGHVIDAPRFEEFEEIDRLLDTL